uniref:Uncharacterized protein n=1 Tax=Plectus sambesii TaxID=2011161 RepID=A0A914X876_9BILA
MAFSRCRRRRRPVRAVTCRLPKLSDLRVTRRVRLAGAERNSAAICMKTRLCSEVPVTPSTGAFPPVRSRNSRPLSGRPAPFGDLDARLPSICIILPIYSACTVEQCRRLVERTGRSGRVVIVREEAMVLQPQATYDWKGGWKERPAGASCRRLLGYSGPGQE